MFTNIGQKICFLAKTLCWLGLILSLIIGSASLAMAESGIAIYFSILIMIFGPLLSWVGSFVLYGYGELIESTQNTEQKVGLLINIVRPKRNPPYAQQAREPTESEPVSRAGAEAPPLCPHCAHPYVKGAPFCPYCGKAIN